MNGHGPRSLTGTSKKIRVLRNAIPGVARSDATVLLTGETGTGKGVIAHQIHEAGPRRGKTFTHVDCAALSPTLIESELFGHEKGAFTDAVVRRLGRFELSGDGTIFLDEIGDLDRRLQAKLLRVLENREFERVGGIQTISMNARVIAATHRDLAALVERGEFRADLFYRLDVLHLEVPPLRERLGDISSLADLLLARIHKEDTSPRLSEDALSLLCRHTWPGNVRELSNVLERCVALRSSQKRPDADALISKAAVERALARSSRHRQGPGLSSEREAIATELVASGGNVRRAARRLGLARGTLRYRIQRYSLGHLLPRG